MLGTTWPPGPRPRRSATPAVRRRAGRRRAPRATDAAAPAIDEATSASGNGPSASGERERLAAERKAREQELADAEAEEAAARAQQESDEAERDRADERHTAARDRVTELAEALDAARDEEQTALEALRAAATAARDSARDAAAAAVRTTRARTRLEQLPAAPSTRESARPARECGSARVGTTDRECDVGAAVADPDVHSRPRRTDSRGRPAVARHTGMGGRVRGGGAGTPSEHRTEGRP